MIEKAVVQMIQTSDYMKKIFIERKKSLRKLLRFIPRRPKTKQSGNHQSLGCMCELTTTIKL